MKFAANNGFSWDSPLLNELLTLAVDIISLESKKQVEEGMKHGVYPKTITDEQQGIVDGCKMADPKTQVTLDRVRSLGVAIDIMATKNYTKGMTKTLKDGASKQHISKELKHLLSGATVLSFNSLILIHRAKRRGFRYA